MKSTPFSAATSNALSALLILFIFTNLHADFTQQGKKLVGTGASVDAPQGSSVSLSSDGNTAIVGASGDSNGVGAAWIWTRAAGVWSQQGKKLVGSGAVGAAAQGSAVSLSSDGNTAMVGGMGDSNGIGAAWVWTRVGGVWSQLGKKLVGVGSDSSSEQGTSVSMSAEGNTAIVGGRGDSGRTSAAYIWTRAGDLWSQQGRQLVGTGDGNSANLGAHVSLSSDGNTAVVGGSGDNCIWIWTRSGGVWSQQGDPLVGTGDGGFAEQGYSVSISSDGNTAVVGGPADSGAVGAVWVWKRANGVWLQQGKKLVGADAVGNSLQGGSVCISSDGGTILVGGIGDDNYSGAQWVFTQSGSSLLNLTPKAHGYMRRNGDLLQFSLPKSEKAAMNVYNLNGKLVSKLWNDPCGACLYGPAHFRVK